MLNEADDDILNEAIRYLWNDVYQTSSAPTPHPSLSVLCPAPSEYDSLSSDSEEDFG